MKIKNILYFGAVGSIIIGLTQILKLKKEILQLRDDNAKMSEFYFVLIKWLNLRLSNGSIVEYFKKNNYKRIAIYGIKELGQSLYTELKPSEIEVAYFIDRDADKFYGEIDIVGPNDEMEKVDAVVVTAIHYFASIKKDLSNKMDCPIIPLEEVLNNN